MKRLIIVLTALVLLASTAITLVPASAQTTTMNITYTWTAPTTGSPVHHYVVQASFNGGQFSTVAGLEPTTRTATITAPVGVPVQVRVAGVDAQNRQGPYSEASDPFVPDAGAPGVPSKPIRQ